VRYLIDAQLPPALAALARGEPLVELA